MSPPAAAMLVVTASVAAAVFHDRDIKMQLRFLYGIEAT